MAPWRPIWRIRLRARRKNEAERGRGPDVDDRRQDDRPDVPDRVQERRENRRDYDDDRRDDRRQFARGVRYSSVWWTSNSCRQTVVVVQDGYSYYQCNGAWFGRTYYGGKVTLFAADAAHVLVSINGAPTDTNAIEVVAPRYRIKRDSWRVVGGDIVLFDPAFTDGFLMFDLSISKQKVKGMFIQDNVFIEGCASSGKVSAK
jgi:hypothetical protein